ncbi:carbohydrate-binding protein [Actinospica robiniae]|uniref:carbohydrate-binding protein n=1 Tax=Actinospica robiniae TaxID=304901 RepID=UPI0006863729|nr:carbohydrate-binding protein [Actinospica robiniae]
MVFGLSQPAAAASLTTAWQNGAFSVNTGGVVSRSDIVLGSPNTANSQSLPLGNGSLGVAAWAANGFTAQLNRSDTMPYRLSPGQVNIPGLSAMTSASNFSGYLDLYNGVLDESGGGMTLQAWVPAGKDELVVNVTGANPSTQESATLNLWSGRSPSTAASGAIASFAQTWVDNSQAGYSNQTFGAMAALTAGGQNVSASVVNGTQVKVTFNPNSDGSFRVVVASPQWTGGNATTTAQSLIGGDTSSTAASLLSTQSAWWNGFWANSGLIEANSSDGTAQYLENLRTLYLYDEAASMKAGNLPGSQAGVANMFNWNEDQQDWYPAGYWMWNLRGQITANESSGNFALNTPIFDMYLNDLPTTESWTSAQMGGKPGACVPETMRFNGNGYYNGGSVASGSSCALAASPNYNAENVTSGAELALYVWQQYQDTGSISFLQKYYPIIQQTATFLYNYQSLGSDGFLHAVANAHETQWAVQDPTDDLVADQALFNIEINAATALNTDASLVSQMRTALTEIEPYPRVNQSNQTQLLNSQPTSASAAASADSGGADVIGMSYQPSAATHNGENIGLETVWPYGQIGDNTVVNGDNLTALADRTYTNRPNKTNPDWNFDAVQAARLDLGSEVANDLTTVTENYQAYISGLANLFNGSVGTNSYIEQQSTVATAMDEALATQYDGTLRFAPAWPSNWDGSGTVYVQGGTKVDVQVESGTLATAAIQAGSNSTITVKNPWPGQQAQVVNGSSGAVIVSPTTAATFSLPMTAGTSYLVEQPSNPTTSMAFAQVTGTAATTYRTLGGKVQIGLPGNSVSSSYPNLAASFNDVAITADNNTNPGNYDGGGASFSETALTNAGAGPGATVTSSGVAFTMPNVAGSTNDNTVAQGQKITMSGSGTLGFLVSASYGPATGSGTITYTDGSTQSYTLNVPDWWSTTAPSGGAVAVTSAYQNRANNTTYAQTGDIFSIPITLTSGKPVASVTLPSGGALTSGTAAIHVFAMATTGAGAESPYGGSAAAVPGSVQAENYDTGGQGVAYNVTSVNGNGTAYRADGVDLETTSDTGGGDDLGWTGTGQWFKYAVNVATAGTYQVSFRVAAPSGVTDAFHLSNSAGTNLSGNVNIASSGGWQTWETVTANLTLPAGQQTLTLNEDNGGWNINALTFASSQGPYGGTAAAIPGTLQAENYDTGGQGVAYNVTSVNGNGTAYRPDGVDLETTSDTGGGDDLGWTATGQWFKYTVNVATAGTHTISFRVAAPSAVTDGFHLSNASGTNLSGNVNVAATGGWQTWETVTATVTLPAGQQTLTLNEDNGGWNINFMTVS